MGDFEGMKLEEVVKFMNENYQFKPDSGFVSICKGKELYRDLLYKQVAFSQKELMHLSYPQTYEPFIFLDLKI